MHRALQAILILIAVGGCAAVMPSHNIPVRPDYIGAGVQPGDTLEITTLDGEERTIEVLGVRTDAIEAADGDVAITDIRSIVKRSWTLPGPGTQRPEAKKHRRLTAHDKVPREHPCNLAGVPV